MRDQAHPSDYFSLWGAVDWRLTMLEIYQRYIGRRIRRPR